jgi:hypothetical protein
MTEPERATEHAQRFPPPLNSSKEPQEYQPVFMECGVQVRLRGLHVECTRRKGHPVDLRYGHSNGYVQWCFE